LSSPRFERRKAFENNAIDVALMLGLMADARDMEIATAGRRRRLPEAIALSNMHPAAAGQTRSLGYLALQPSDAERCGESRPKGAPRGGCKPEGQQTATKRQGEWT